MLQLDPQCDSGCSRARIGDKEGTMMLGSQSFVCEHGATSSPVCAGRTHRKKLPGQIVGAHLIPVWNMLLILPCSRQPKHEVMAWSFWAFWLMILQCMGKGKGAGPYW